MAQITVAHRVKDFDTWKVIYDEDKPRRDQLGLTERAIYRDANDGNSILLSWEGNPDVIQDMFSDPELKAKMEEAGVISAPEIIVGEKKEIN